MGLYFYSVVSMWRKNCINCQEFVLGSIVLAFLIALLQNANLIRIRISKLTRTRISTPFNVEKKQIAFFHRMT